jgi:DNA-binding response OmpR family regulator
MTHRADGPVYIADFPQAGFLRSSIAARHGLVCCLAMPIRTTAEPLYCLLLFDRRQRSDIDSMQFAVQVACDELGLYLSLQQLEHAGGDNGHGGSVAVQLVTHQLSFDPRNQTLEGPRGTLRLSGIEWDVFDYLAQHHGDVVSHEDLMLRVWGVVDSNSRNSVYEIMSRLRGHLVSIGVDRSALRVVSKKGYTLSNET